MDKKKLKLTQPKLIRFTKAEWRAFEKIAWKKNLTGTKYVRELVRKEIEDEELP